MSALIEAARDALPDLPEPAAHTLEWHARGGEDIGWLDFYAANDKVPSDWDGPPPDEVQALFTADQMRAYAIEALAAAEAQPTPSVQPVAWRYKGMMGMPWSLSDDGYFISCKKDGRYFVEPLFTAPPSQPAPAGWSKE